MALSLFLAIVPLVLTQNGVRDSERQPDVFGKIPFEQKWGKMVKNDPIIDFRDFVKLSNCIIRFG